MTERTTGVKIMAGIIDVPAAIIARVDRSHFACRF
jgi:hypothetical protein